METKKRLFICVYAHFLVICTCLYFSVAKAPVTPGKDSKNKLRTLSSDQVLKRSLNQPTFRETDLEETEFLDFLTPILSKSSMAF